MEERQNIKPSGKWLGLNRWKVFGLVVLAAGITIFYVSNVVRIDNMLAEIRELEKEQKILKVRAQYLHADINRLESPGRIIPIAQEKLGMVIPSELPETIK